MRAWIMDAETLPYVLKTMSNPNYLLKPLNVIPHKKGKVLLIFQGEYSFIERGMKEDRPDIQLDEESWPRSVGGV